MKIECVLEKIVSSVQQVGRSTSKGSLMPVLQGILIEGKDGFLSFTATNLETGIYFKIPAKVEREGKILVSGEVFTKVISTIPQNNKKITLEVIGDVLSLETEVSKIKIKTLPLDEFPNLPTVEGSTFSIKKSDFIQGIKSVSFASASIDIKPEISSVYFYTKDGEMIFVATDSFRLAEKRIKYSESTTDIKVLLPFKNIGDILRSLEELADDILEITFSNTVISFTSLNFYFTSRIIDGRFPDYHKIIPGESSTDIKILKQDLQNILKTTTIFSDKFNKITFSLNSEEKKLLCKTINPDIGEASYEIEVGSEGNSIEMSFNHKHISEVVSIFSRESIHCSCTTENKPMLLRGVGDSSFLYLIMPLNR
jgi:DNA polymerase-3 subunit beta